MTTEKNSPQKAYTKAATYIAAVIRMFRKYIPLKNPKKVKDWTKPETHRAEAERIFGKLLLPMTKPEGEQSDGNKPRTLEVSFHNNPPMNKQKIIDELNVRHSTPELAEQVKADLCNPRITIQLQGDKKDKTKT